MSFTSAFAYDGTITSGQDLTGNVMGQTKDIVVAKMKAAAGGILFIDEAYDLGRPGYGQEAMTTLLRLLTEPDYTNDKTIVIVAGYEDDMADMMARNQGMRSRFKRTIKFEVGERGGGGGRGERFSCFRVYEKSCLIKVAPDSAFKPVLMTPPLILSSVGLVGKELRRAGRLKGRGREP